MNLHADNLIRIESQRTNVQIFVIALGSNEVGQSLYQIVAGNV